MFVVLLFFDDADYSEAAFLQLVSLQGCCGVRCGYNNDMLHVSLLFLKAFAC